MVIQVGVPGMSTAYKALYVEAPLERDINLHVSSKRNLKAVSSSLLSLLTLFQGLRNEMQSS